MDFCLTEIHPVYFSLSLAECIPTTIPKSCRFLPDSRSQTAIRICQLAGHRGLPTKAAWARSNSSKQFYCTNLPTYSTKMGPPSNPPLQPWGGGYYHGWPWSMGIYWSMPANAECNFTLCTEVPEKRSIFWGTVPFYRDMHVWSGEQIQARANYIRAKYPEQASKVVRPTSQTDLYKYFDAMDLYINGAYNLLWVILRLCDENDGIAQHIDNTGCFDTVDDWAYKWCTHGENRRKLSGWDRRGDILDIMTPEDWKSIGNSDNEALNMLRSVLWEWYSKYFALDPVNRPLPFPSPLPLAQVARGHEANSGQMESDTSFFQTQNGMYSTYLSHLQPLMI